MSPSRSAEPAPNGTSKPAQQQQQQQQPPPTPPPPPPPSTSSSGPHPGFIVPSSQYRSELAIRRQQRAHASDPSREATSRLQGVELIDKVRARLRLPVRTFDTAAVYFHKFRLAFRDADYNYQDAALASLFVACKVEDTIKKSRDILAAAFSVKNPDKTVPADDKIFEAQSKVIIGLERLILETIGFDYRTRYPQKLLVKIVRAVLPPSSRPEAAKHFFSVAYALCTDMYRTFVPLKRTTFSMVMAVVELTARLLGQHLDDVTAFARGKASHSRAAVAETMLDLLDMYVQHSRSTKLGALFDLNLFMDIKIQLNLELEKAFEQRHLYFCNRCDNAGANHGDSGHRSAGGSRRASSPSLNGASAAATPKRSTARGGTSDGTMRFVFDPDTARAEVDAAAKYRKEEFEEYEIEVEEPIPPAPTPPPQHPRGPRDDRGGRRSRNRGGDRWAGGPYGRGGGGGGGGGGFRPDRRRGGGFH
ncbi:hypothetical protein N3K66_007723 [Trichothecium roseum]|uniref:Uncharacterized protein n=1 Tax=Trichothecium roseum TaxID=47278 RepID=A0ACC0UWG9_9HYPO|nr:hypothetical protein N3K66_007723 [Trichothecium roseum]